MDHTRLGDMVALADRIRAVPRRRVAHFASGVMTLGLMRTSPLVHGVVWLTRVVLRCTVFESWSLLFTREVALAENLCDSFATHVEVGQDRTDPRSIGGLSADEVVLTLELLQMYEDRATQEP